MVMVLYNLLGGITSSRNNLIKMVSFSNIILVVLICTDCGFSNALQNIDEPCNRFPCGHNTVCSTHVNDTAAAVCGCVGGYEPDSHPIYGCNILCVADADCPNKKRCKGGKCRPTTCFDKCGINARCAPSVSSLGALRFGSAGTTCRCNRGYTGNPLVQCNKIDFQTFHTTYEKANRNPNCPISPCGRGAVCAINVYGIAECECLNNGTFLGRHPIFGCQTNCTTNFDCSPGQEYCQKTVCVPCSSSPLKCGVKALCNSGHDQPTCHCPSGHEGNPLVECIRIKAATTTTTTSTTTTTTRRPITSPTPRPQPTYPPPTIHGPKVKFECGTRTSIIDTGKIRGTEAKLSKKFSWPWMALLGSVQRSHVHVAGNIKLIEVNNWMCGGVLINERWILSAAHCMNTETLFHVRLGQNNRIAGDEDDFQPIDYQVEDIEQHPNYDASFPRYYDFSLVKTTQLVKITYQVRPICLPWHLSSPEVNLEGNEGFITGWGATTYKGEPSTYLRDTKVTIMNTQECHRNYSGADPSFDKTIPRGIIDELIICANDPVTRADACKGDSGGPLALRDVHDEKLRFTVVGVISGGLGCGTPHLPGLYGPVARELEWIKDMAFSTDTHKCRRHEECFDDEKCFARKCRSVCPGNCAPTAMCVVNEDRRPICSCAAGMMGNAHTLCYFN